MDPIVLRTERLVLSVTTADDVGAITRLCQDREMLDVLASLPWPYTRADAEFFVNDIVTPGWASGDSLTWSIREREGGPHLGSIGWRRALHDIGFWMGAPHRGRGYMTEAVRAVCSWVFDALGEERIHWEAVAGNLASAHVARSAGFRYDGERPVELQFRDGSHPLGWHAYRLRSDDGAPQQDWPL